MRAYPRNPKTGLPEPESISEMPVRIQARNVRSSRDSRAIQPLSLPREDAHFAVHHCRHAH